MESQRRRNGLLVCNVVIFILQCRCDVLIRPPFYLLLFFLPMSYFLFFIASCILPLLRPLAGNKDNVPTLILWSLYLCAFVVFYMLSAPAILIVGAAFIIKIPERASREFENLLRALFPVWFLYPNMYVVLPIDV
jgi:hypothetical protein